MNHSFWKLRNTIAWNIDRIVSNGVSKEILTALARMFLDSDIFLIKMTLEHCCCSSKTNITGRLRKVQDNLILSFNLNAKQMFTGFHHWKLSSRQWIITFTMVQWACNYLSVKKIRKSSEGIIVKFSGNDNGKEIIKFGNVLDPWGILTFDFPSIKAIGS